jgi:hypothetical protein
MKIIICGTRTMNDAAFVKECLDKSKFRSVMTEVLTGGAGGVDTIAYWWARFNKIPCRVFRARWSDGPWAGPLRNHKMVKEADGLIAIWEGTSRGTRNTIRNAEEAGIPVEVHTFKQTTII